MPMSLKKAIEILHLALLRADYVSAADVIDATELGIEALKRIKKSHDGGWFIPGGKLPGETED